MTTRTRLERKQVDDVLGGDDMWKHADSTAGACTFHLSTIQNSRHILQNLSDMPEVRPWPSVLLYAADPFGRRAYDDLYVHLLFPEHRRSSAFDHSTVFRYVLQIAPRISAYICPVAPHADTNGGRTKTYADPLAYTPLQAYTNLSHHTVSIAIILGFSNKAIEETSSRGHRTSRLKSPRAASRPSQ